MQVVKPSVPTVQYLGSSGAEVVSSTLTEVNSHLQEDDVPATALANEAHLEKGTPSRSTHSGTGRTNRAVLPWKNNGYFGNRLCEEIMPITGWRRRIYMVIFVAVISVIILSFCSIPAILYFTALVSKYLIKLETLN